MTIRPLRIGKFYCPKTHKSSVAKFNFRALFGYEPHSNDLKVVATGDGGLEELNEDLNTSNIMYAYVRVADPKTSLTKYVLINWQVSLSS